MAFKMKGSQLYGKLKLNRNMDDSSQPDGRAKSSVFQKAGAFVDGERVTYDAARAAEEEGGNVTYTNKEAEKRNEENLKSTNKQTRAEAEQFTKMKPYKGEKGEEKEFNQAKIDDAKAQALLERRTKNLAKKGHRDAGVMDEEGRKGSNAKIESEKAFEEANKNIKSETVVKESGEEHQGVKGASKTISTTGAKKGTTGSKNKTDYAKEARDKRIAELKAKANKQK